jgi:hypothetical protein
MASQEVPAPVTIVKSGALFGQNKLIQNEREEGEEQRVKRKQDIHES